MSPPERLQWTRFVSHTYLAYPVLVLHTLPSGLTDGRDASDGWWGEKGA